MSILKYKDPKTGEFKRINPYKSDLSFVGKDGIVVNKAADSEKIEISGSGLVPSYTVYNDPQVYTAELKLGGIMMNTVRPIATYSGKCSNGNIAAYFDNRTQNIPVGVLLTGTPRQEAHATNKKYVDDNYVAKVKFANLEQALNGYILDTTKEAYADLDSAVLKNSVALGDNVYPIADKTRALVTRIEGKTTKMVQLANTEAVLNTQTQNGITLIKNADGSLTANGTATAKTWGLFAIGGSYIPTVAGSKYLLLGSPNGCGSDTYSLIDGNGKITEGVIRTSDGSSLSIRVVFAAGFVAENITFKPQLFNLTAIYKEGNEPTTVEQFKADFPSAFYPYAKGDLYPAKISGVKFYEKQDKSGEQASVTLPDTYDLHGIGDNKDYLEITKNENNELYTLKKVQSVEVNESEKTITPLATPVETVIATNLTYEQVTAIRHNGGLIEVEGNTNKGYAKPTIKNTVVYRLTATSKAEG